MEMQECLFHFNFLNTILGINRCCSGVKYVTVDKLICVIRYICAGEGVDKGNLHGQLS